MKIKIYTNDYLATLEEKLANGTFRELFEDGIFNDPNEETIDYILPDDKYPLKSFNAEGNDDIDNAIALYETYRLNRVEASNRGLWTYLSLHTYAEYNKEHFNINKDVKNYSEYVSDHYLLAKSSTGMMRHTLCGLWWAVYLTVDEKLEDKYELTRVLLRQKSFYARFLGINLIALKPAVQGILQFIKNNEELFKDHFESRMRMISIIVNRLGGTKLIAAMDKDFFIQELENRKGIIEKSISREAIKTLI